MANADADGVGKNAGLQRPDIIMKTESENMVKMCRLVDDDYGDDDDDDVTDDYDDADDDDYDDDDDRVTSSMMEDGLPSKQFLTK